MAALSTFTAAVTLLGIQQPAFASCGNGGYMYAQAASPTGGYQGLERYVSVPAVTLPSPSSQHVAFWLGITDPNAACPVTLGMHECWVQSGHCIGYCGPYHNSLLIAYFETMPPNSWGGSGGYTYFNHPEIGLAQNTFYNVYNTGTVAYGQYVYYGYAVDSGGHADFLGDGALQSNTGYAQGAAEVDTPKADNCPSLSASGTYQYFGTNGGGGVSSGTWLDAATTPAPNNWSQWTNGGAYSTPGSPYSIVYLAGGAYGSSAFRTSG